MYINVDVFVNACIYIYNNNNDEGADRVFLWGKSFRKLWLFGDVDLQGRMRIFVDEMTCPTMAVSQCSPQKSHWSG